MRKYFLATSMSDRINFDTDAEQFGEECATIVLSAGNTPKLSLNIFKKHREAFMEGIEVDDVEEATARFKHAFSKGWKEIREA